MNNKGFAITTLIYGLAIMALLLITIIMATLSSTRRSIRDLSNTVEKELISYSKSSVEFDGKSKVTHIYTIPQDEGGYYRIEAWGPKSGSYYGGYATGIIRLEAKQPLYIYTGGLFGNSTFVSALKTFEDYAYMDDEYQSTPPVETMILQAAPSGNIYMVGAPVAKNRVFTDDFKSPNPEYTYFFNDTLIVRRVNDNPYGRVKIQKLVPIKDFNYQNTLNGRYWENAYMMTVEVTPADKYEALEKRCSLFYTVTSRDNTIDSSKIQEWTIQKPVGLDTNPAGVYTKSANISVKDILLYCPGYEETYKDLNFKISVKNGNSKPGAKHMVNTAYGQTDYGTLVYDGPFKSNDNQYIRLSQFQPDSIVDKPDHGNYYIMPYTDRGYVLTLERDSSTVSLSPIASLDTQRWAIDKVGDVKNAAGEVIDKEFRLVESSSFKALDIREDENRLDNTISARYTFNSLSRNEPQIWRLIPNRDGTYSIKTIVQSVDDVLTGYVTYDKENPGESPLTIGLDKGAPEENQKFVFYSLDYNTLSK